MDMLPVIRHDRPFLCPIRFATPIGSVILTDGESRLEWSHALPEGEPTERWTFMLKFRHIADNIVGYSELLDSPPYACKLNPDARRARGSWCERGINPER